MAWPRAASSWSAEATCGARAFASLPPHNEVMPQASETVLNAQGEQGTDYREQNDRAYVVLVAGPVHQPTPSCGTHRHTCDSSPPRLRLGRSHDSSRVRPSSTNPAARRDVPGSSRRVYVRACV